MSERVVYQVWVDGRVLARTSSERFAREMTAAILVANPSLAALVSVIEATEQVAEGSA